MVARLFTDYVDFSGGTVQYGAGPSVNFIGGIGPAELAAAQHGDRPIPPVYQPTSADGTPGLELNPSNATEGDMVAGTYGSNPSYQPDANDPGGLYAENSSYGRRDFQPAPASTAATAPAFLVRMRRTTDPDGIDQRVWHQFRRSDAANSVWPRQPDGTERQRY